MHRKVHPKIAQTVRSERFSIRGFFTTLFILNQLTALFGSAGYLLKQFLLLFYTEDAVFALINLIIILPISSHFAYQNLTRNFYYNFCPMCNLIIV